jgi:hypothetical protein
LINFYPPYWGAGISVVAINDAYTQIDVQMKMRFWNKNLVGTHFGGSLYSMCDPFYMFILIQHLGKDYIVWDKSASIHFKKPGMGVVRASFHISLVEIVNIKTYVDTNGKGNFTFDTNIFNEKDEIVATVEKVIYVKKKNV